jgi:hypothetical protein
MEHGSKTTQYVLRDHIIIRELSPSPEYNPAWRERRRDDVLKNIVATISAGPAWPEGIIF